MDATVHYQMLLLYQALSASAQRAVQGACVRNREEGVWGGNLHSSPPWQVSVCECVCEWKEPFSLGVYFLFPPQLGQISSREWSAWGVQGEVVVLGGASGRYDRRKRKTKEERNMTALIRFLLLLFFLEHKPHCSPIFSMSTPPHRSLLIAAVVNLRCELLCAVNNWWGKTGVRSGNIHAWQRIWEDTVIWFTPWI